MKPIRRASPLLSLLLPALALALAAAPQRAAADPPRAGTSATADATGRAHFKRGQRLSAKGDYAAAYREFAAGYAVTRRPLFLFNMAEAARAIGDVARARENYLEFLRLDPNNALATTARTRLDDLDRAAGTSRTEPVAAPPPATAPVAAAPPAAGPPAVPPPAAAIAPGEPRRDPLPLLPPSATRPQPPGMTPSAPQAEPIVATRDAADRPLWKKWPFWAVVGGSLIAGGVITYAATRNNALCGEGCSQVDFR